MAALALTFLLLAAGCSADRDDEPQAQDSTPAEGSSPSPDQSPTDTDQPDEDLEAMGFTSDLTVLVANSAGTLTTVGPQRILTALVGDGPNSFLGGADSPVTVRYEPVNGDTVGEVDGTWLTTSASSLGLYVTYYEFDQPGIWEVTAFGDGIDLGATLIDVVETSDVPRIGDPAPRSETLTASTQAEIAAISTDLDPDPSYYDLTIAEAVENGTPTVVAFVTPAFCQTALCGPTLDTVKTATAGRTDIDVIHVEPYDLALAPIGNLVPIPILDEWGLVTEPWVFVGYGDGQVTASFEGIIGLEELEAALAVL